MKLAWRLAALKNGFQDATAYRAEFFLDILGSALVPAAIQWVFWYALFNAQHSNRVAGMSYTEMIHYTWVSLLFSQIRGGDHDFDLQEMIRSGQLSNYLLRPVSVVEFIYIRGVSPRIFIALICLVIGIFVEIGFGMSPMRIFGSMFLALLGNVIHYQIGATLATAAFLWEEAYSILLVKNMLVSLLSGELIPLNLFPVNMQWVWKITPFYLYVYGPTQYALGRWSHGEMIYQIGISILWMLGLWGVVRISWRSGIKRYASLGG